MNLNDPFSIKIPPLYCICIFVGSKTDRIRQVELVISLTHFFVNSMSEPFYSPVNLNPNSNIQ